MKKYLKYIGIALAVFLIVAQFFPIDKTNPPADMTKDFIEINDPSAQIAEHIKVACYDCHSHHTKYPWYTNVAPVSWWIKGHMENGMKHLNFSTWGDYSQKKKDHKLDECIDFVEKNWMPLLTYKIAHPESKLTDGERADLIAFFKGLK
ncbi:MAG: hypothetical protein ACJA1A_003777 [Saprospiraceae bacterium]|jgi:hypothetical protein|tara:strand:+ start:660 stop:1106 length:447 start_codon:yes stop_codon:yes gene_type:complete